MANIRQWLEAAVKKYGEPIEAMVVGRHDSADWKVPLGADECVVIAPEAGLAKVDQEFDNGYGGADCYPIFAWTRSRVFFISEYDGATWLVWVPRNPMDGPVSFSGNGD